jgi:hypothetical protein
MHISTSIKIYLKTLQSHKNSNNFLCEEHDCSLMQLKPMLPQGHGYSLEQFKFLLLMDMIIP